MAVKLVGQVGEVQAQGHTEDDGQVGGHFQNAVGFGNFFFADQFGDNAIFGGAEKGALGGHEK